MSNCIEIHNGAVVFTSSECRIVDLKARIEEVNKQWPSKFPSLDVSSMTAEQKDKYYTDNTIWWFLATNTKFVDECAKCDASLTIMFGRGRSSHTWRDFKGTLKVLAAYMIKSKVHTFTLSDEYDNFDASYPLKVNLMNPLKAFELAK